MISSTVPGRGYRLLRPPQPPAVAEPAPESSLPLPDKPSLAVLPFVNLSGDPEQEYFADGMGYDAAFPALVLLDHPAQCSDVDLKRLFSSTTTPGQTRDITVTQNEPGGIVALTAQTQQILGQALRQIEFATVHMIARLSERDHEPRTAAVDRSGLSGALTAFQWQYGLLQVW